jgi:hypothetical protein
VYHDQVCQPVHSLLRPTFRPEHLASEDDMHRIDPVEILSGLFVAGIGLFFFLGAAEYPMGQINRMGPGFVPRSLGAIGIGLGLIILTGAIRVPGRFPTIAWRPLAAITGGIVLFAVLLPRFGLVVATLVASIVSMLGNPDADWRMISMTSVSISVVCWVLFILVLGLPIPAFWTDV